MPGMNEYERLAVRQFLGPKALSGLISLLAVTNGNGTCH